MSPVVAEPSTAWWGVGVPPTERWPGVTISIDECGGKYRFDEALADRVCGFFPRYCSHSKGEFAGQAFAPLDYQTQLILRPIFGWIDRAGLRRFRKAFIEIPKKNGKTQLIAGLALYMLLGDNEPGAEIYVAAADRDQARILFAAAKSMVEASPALAKRLQVYQNYIARKDDTAAFFKVLSAEAATKHGPNIHCLIIDELHAQPDRELFETLTRGVIARRQPLILLITTAGDDDESICVAPDTKVLTSDLRWVRAGDVQAGDVLAGFDEHRPFNGRGAPFSHRSWRSTSVESRSSAELPSYRLALTDGTVVTSSAGHMWMVQTAGRRTEWRRTEDLTETDSFCKVLDVWDDDTTYDAGYLAGVLDSEGHLSATERSHLLCGFTQNPNELSARAQALMTARGFRFGIYDTRKNDSPGTYQTMVTRKRDVLRMLGTIRPPRLLRRFQEIGWDHLRFKAFDRPRLVSKEFLGVREVIGLKTTTHTFVAEGMASHNCYEEYDYARRVLSGTIQDERHLPVIFEAQAREWTERIQSSYAIGRLDIMCTCQLPPIALTATGRPERAVCAPHATSNSCSTEIPNTKQGRHESAPSGSRETLIGCAPQGVNGGKNLPVSSIWPSGTGENSTDSRARNTSNSATDNQVDAASAARAQSCASIIATIAKKLEAYSVPNAIADSVFWETLQTACALHSPTCAVRTNARIDGSELLVRHPADDWKDPSVLARVNPAVGTTIKLETLMASALEAQNEPRKRNDFVRYHTNRWTNQATAWIPVEWWDACEGPLDDAFLQTLECAGGLDLAQKWDLACFAVVFRQYLETAAPELEVLSEEPNGKVVTKRVSLNYRLFVRPFFWIPENTMQQHAKDDGVPYPIWSEEKSPGTDWPLVTPTEGDIIDYTKIYEDITTKILPRYPKLKQGTIGYDPAFATDLSTKLRDVAGLQIVEILQNYKNISEPAQILEALIKGQRVHHDGHRVLRWNWENVSVKTERDTGRIRPVKPRNASKRIDGAVAMIMGDKALSLQQPPVQPQYQMIFVGGRR